MVEKRWVMIEDGDDRHAIPNWETHEATALCNCCPVVDHEDYGSGERIWKHNTRMEAN